MPKQYTVNGMVRLVNSLITGALRLGISLGSTYLLTVRGRRSGQLHTTPVTLIEHGAERWLVAPYGAVAWVHNARAARKVVLTRGRRQMTARVQELGPEDGAPILKKYVRQVTTVRPYLLRDLTHPLMPTSRKPGATQPFTC
jgi:deazaflavin-dependent oxidoreductase (nitroreductase family)